MALKKKSVRLTDSPVLQEVKKLYDFMQNNRLETVEFSQAGTQVRLVRKRSPSVPVPVYAQAPAGNNGAGQSKPSAAPVQEQLGDVIASPLMGIFFRSPSPSSPPFMREGDAVKSGQVLCLIESMKVFNEVKAECDCVIKKVLVEDGRPVKPGQPLFAIERK
jgi:acetyl-CoA carboxylase biotin carboxyl carrier protein